MSEWLLGVVGVISLGLLLEILIPEGQTSKYVRGAFSLLVIFVVISPLPKLLGGEYDLNFDDVSYEIDSDYVIYTSSQYESSLENDVEKVLAGEGIISMVEIVTKEGSVRDIDFVSVKIYLSGIDEKVVNTHISRAEEVVQDCLKISREKVRVSVEYGSG